MVFALGVVLLELSWGKPLSDLKTTEDLDDQGKEDSMTELSIASRLVDLIRTRELPNYAQAVTRCVSCDFGTPSYDFHDKDFRERFYEDVIVPLQKDYEYAVGTHLRPLSISITSIRM